MSNPRTSSDPVVRGTPIIVSGPAGVGKTVVTRRLVERFEDLTFSVSATTRDKRPNEVEGRDYYFISRDEFRERMARGEFLETTERIGKLYGTLRAPLEAELTAGRDVILDVDVYGGEAMRKIFPSGLFIYLLPPSYEDQARRLRNRARDPEDEIQKRLALGIKEARFMAGYDFLVVNREIEDTITAMRKIVEADRYRKDRCLDVLIHLGCVSREIGEIIRGKKE